MFRDGIFENFGDFLDKIMESTLVEGMKGLTHLVLDMLSDKGYEADFETIFQYLNNLSDEDYRYLENQVAEGNEEGVVSILSDLDLKKVEEGKGGYVCVRCGSRHTAEVEGKIKCLKCGHVEEMVPGEKLNIPLIKSEAKIGTCPKCGEELGTAEGGDIRCLKCGWSPQSNEENESKLQEPVRKDAEQTMKPQEESPEGDAEALSMEDWSDTDKEGKPKRKDKVEYPSKLQQLKDKNMMKENRKDPLHLCNECFKTFRSEGMGCLFCGSPNTERISKNESKIKEIDSDVPMYKCVFAVHYKLDGRENQTRVEAFDVADAEKYVKNIKPGANILSTKKIGETKVNEIYQEKRLGDFKVVFQDGHTEDLPADSKVDAMNKAKKAYTKSTISHVLVKGKEDGKETSGGFKVTFYDGHTELIKDADSKIDAMDKAKKIYKGCSEVQNVEVLESKLEEGNWWGDLLDSLKKDKKFQKLVSEHGAKSREVLEYFGKRYWSKSATENAVKAALENVLRDLDLVESKADAIKKAKEIYKDSPGVQNVEVLESKYKVKHSCDVCGTSFVATASMEDDKVEVHPRICKKCREEEKNQRSESKLQEQEEDSYTTVAKGLEDKRTADDLARDKKGQVIPDPEDNKKFAVIIKKE